MNTNKALKVSKALIVLVLGIAWVLLKAVFTMASLLFGAVSNRQEEERDDVEQIYALNRTTDETNKYQITALAPED